MPRHYVSNLLGLVGAAVGGYVGFLLFGKLLEQGLYALILPGALMGLGCHVLTRHRSARRGAVCFVAALVLGLFSEWYLLRPFGMNTGFGFFLSNLRGLNQRWWTFAMLILGAVFAFWWGKDTQGWFGTLPAVGGDERPV